MPELTVSRIATGHEVPIPACSGVSDLDRAIGSRAHEIFLERGGNPGKPLDDWIQAEREQSSHVRANLYEDDSGYRASFQLPGFAADEIQVAISPQAVGVHARRRAPLIPEPGERQILSEFSEEEAYRQIAFPVRADPDTAVVHLDHGLAVMRVRKAEAAPVPAGDAGAKGGGA